jgi:NADPH-dependent curcumin reductase CurA
MDEGIATRSPDFAEKVVAITGEGANLAVNCLGGSVFGECMRSLAFAGRIATVGYVDGVHEAEEKQHAQRRRRAARIWHCGIGCF